MSKRKITVEIDETVYDLLAVLSRGSSAESVEGVLYKLIDHAQQGVYRPGAWERHWLRQAFGSDWLVHLERGDPYGREANPLNSPFQRPVRE